MIKGKIELKKILIPSDAVPILVIIVGLIIGIFLHEIAIRLIGVSIAILGAVALFMLISQRISEIVSLRHTPKDSGEMYKVSMEKGPKATRTVIENFDNSFGEDDKLPGAKEKFSAPKKETKTKPADSLKKEKIKEADAKKEVRPLSKRDYGTKTIKPDVPKADSSEKLPEQKTGMEEQPVDFMDGDEGFRIVKKGKPDKPAEDKEAGSRKENPQTSVKEKAEKITAKEEQKSESEKEKKDSSNLAAEKKNVEQKTIATEQAEQPAKNIRQFPPPPEKLEKTSEEERSDSEKKSVVELEKDSPPEISTPDIPPAEDPLPEVNAETPEPDYSYKARQYDFQLSVLTEELPLSGREPREEFEFFLNRILMAIRSVSNTRTAAFLIVNAERGEMIVQALVTDVKPAISRSSRFKMGNDAISQIVSNAKPEILSEINPAAELDLIPYYEKKVRTKTFIGVPVFYEKAVVGVLCADTNVRDVYDEITVNFFGQLTRLISGLVNSYTNKYELLQSYRTLEAINQFRSIMDTQGKSMKDVVNTLMEAAASIFDFTDIGLCGYDEKRDAWAIATRKNKNRRADSQSDTVVDLENTLVGKSILNNKTIVLAPVEGEHRRTHSKEKNLPGGFFVSVPIPLRSIGSTYGALFVEGRSHGSINDYDISILEILCDHAGSSIEKMHIMNMLKSNAMFEFGSGLVNNPAFKVRLEEEFRRSSDLGQPTTLCLFSIDKYASYDPAQNSERMQQIVFHVTKTTKKLLRPYDVFGKAGEKTFGIILVGMKTDQAKIWAERLRREIASSVLPIGEMRFTVTLSIGLAGTKSADSPASLVKNARTVLKKSVTGTNTVTVFS